MTDGVCAEFLRRYSSIVLVFVLLSTGAMAEMPYLTNFDSALAKAKESGRMVILYTGSRELCPGHDPKAFFFGSILGTHLPLGVRSNAYLVCEQFLVNAAHDARGEPSPAFLAEVFKYDALFTRYNLHVFWPAITILDANGASVSGPYTYSAPDNVFGATEHDGYEALPEYRAANPPIHRPQTRGNLFAAITITNKAQQVFHIFRAKYDKKRSQKEILLDSGVSSKAYEVGKEIAFAVRECGAEWFDYKNGRGENQVVAAGQITDPEPYTGSILVQFNGAWFRGHMWKNSLPPNDYRKCGKVSLQPGEFYLDLLVPHKGAGDMLLRAFEDLQKGQENN